MVGTATTPPTPSTPFNGRITRMSDERCDEWLRQDLTGDLLGDRVPCLGAANAAALSRGPANITTTYQLMGKYLSLRGEDTTQLQQLDAFKGWLEGAGVRVHESETIVAAVGAKMNVGVEFNCVQMTEAQMRSSRMGDDEIANFLAKELTGRLADDFTGIGKDGVKQLRRHGITHTCQLFGHLLGQTRDTGAEGRGAAVEAFCEFLKANGVAPAWAFTVLHQVVASINAPGGIALPGDDTYFRPTNTLAQPIIEGDETEAEAEAEGKAAAGEKEAGGGMPWVLALVLLALMFTYFKFVLFAD